MNVVAQLTALLNIKQTGFEFMYSKILSKKTIKTNYTFALVCMNSSNIVSTLYIIVATLYQFTFILFLIIKLIN